MQWAAWEPTYRSILAEFGFSEEEDLAARDLLHDLTIASARADLGALRAKVEGREATIAGPRPATLPGGPLLATDAGAWALPRADAIVTDLDGDVDAQVAANARGVPVFLHAHGDNVAALRAHAARFRGPMQPTTQTAPRGHVANFGGFTDGDRACCLAAALGARSLALAGFDFDAPWPKPGQDPERKLRKLRVARRIVEGLGLPYRFL